MADSNDLNTNLGLFALNDDALSDADMDLGLYLASNPLAIQANMLKLFENRSNGKRYVADANNSYMHLIEGLSEMYGGFLGSILDVMNNWYANRATTDEELHQHISDFEYVGLYAVPASVEIEWITDSDHLLNNALTSEDGFQLARIPADTTIVIGNMTFGLYYPIDIKINTTTGNIIASYNEDNVNPLKAITTVSVSKRSYKKKNLNLIGLTFPVYQFETTTFEESITSDLGFVRTYEFSDQFYAARIYTLIDGSWVEMGTTLSNFNYSPDALTAKIKVSKDLSQVSVDVPYIYFSRSQVGTKIRTVIYTTKGELDVDISDITDSTAKYKYTNSAGDAYVNVLKTSTATTIRTTDNNIFGGSNGSDFETVKNTVLNSTDNTVPITAADVAVKFSKYGGFKPLLKVDDINSREYLAAKHLSFNDDSYVEIVNCSVVIDMDIASELDSVLMDDDRVTILPSTIFKLETEGTKASLVPASEVALINSLTGDDLADYINNSTNTYFSYPYHLFINKQDTYPKATTYDMFDSATINYLMFHQEHNKIALTIDAVATLIDIDTEGTSTITIRVGIRKDDDQIANDQLTCVLTTENTSAEKIGWIGVYEKYSDTTDLHIYKFTLETDFMFNGDAINIPNAKSYTANEPTSRYVELNRQWILTTFVDNTLVPDITPDDELQSYLPYLIATDPIVGVNSFEMDVTLGASIDAYVDNTLTVTWNADEYERHEVDVPAVYDTDVIERDSNGIPIYIVQDDQLILSYLHHKGDAVLDSEGQPVYRFKVGDVKFDAFGQPISVSTNKMNYTVQMFLVNYIYAISSRKIKKNYLYQIRRAFRVNYANLDTIYEDMLENTTISFYPISTLGYVSSSVGGVTTQYDLRLSFDFVFYVNNTVLDNNDTQTAIRDTTISTIEKYLADNTLIAISSLTKVIHDKLTDDVVYSIDIDGFNGTSKKTIVSEDTSKRFVIKTYLAYEELNDTFYHEKAVNITFVGVDQAKNNVQ